MVKKSTFFLYVFFFFTKKCQKETFFDILSRKECFLGLKSKVLTKWKKNRHFWNGLVHGFCKKIDLFLICFFFMSKKSQKETFVNIQGPVVRTRVCANLGLNFNPGFFFSLSKALSRIIFSIFFRVSNHPCFFVRKKSQKRAFFDILDRKECMLFRPEKWSSRKSLKNRHFPKGLVDGFCQKIDFLSYIFFVQRKPERNIFWYSG